MRETSFRSAHPGRRRRSGDTSGADLTVLPDLKRATHQRGRDPVTILLDVIGSMTQASGLDAALRRLAGLALRATGGDRCAILIRDPQASDKLVPAAAATRIGDADDMWHRFRDMEAVDVGEHFELRILLQTEDVIAIEDAATSPLVPQRWHRAWGSRSVALAPLRVNEAGFGILAIDYVDRVHRFDVEEIALLRSIAAAASLALRDADLLDQVRKKAALEQHLTDCIALLSSRRSVRDILSGIADAFQILLPEVSFSINVVSADRRSFHPVAWRGSEPSEETFALADLPLREVARIRQTWRTDPERPITVDDLTAYPAWRAVVDDGLDVGMLVPLTSNGSVIGWIAAGRAGPPFSEQEVRVARVFAGHAAIAVGQASLRDEVEARARVTDALFLLGERAGRLSDPHRLVKGLNRELYGLSGLRCLRLAVASPTLARELRLPVVRPEERTLLAEWRHAPAPRLDGTSLAVPVRAAERLVGVLWLETGARPDALTVSLANALAAAIGDVVWKARLRRRSESRAVDLALAKERERIAQDLHDTVGQILYSIGLRLHDASLRTDDDVLRRTLQDIRGQAAAGMHEVRASIYAQSAVQSDRAGFVRTVRDIAHRFTLATGIEVDLRIDGRIGRVPKELSRSLTRMLHELFVNVERHARAQFVVLTITSLDDVLVLSLRDDGVGLKHREEGGWQGSANFGMRSVAKTVRDLGGSFEAKPAQPIGLEVRLRIPRRQRR